jgi:proteic killer suppression protein
MIRSFGNKATAHIFQGIFVHSLPPHVQAISLEKLRAIDIASTPEDLRQPPGNRLQALRGQRSGQWSIRINAQWRICFQFVGADTFNVEIVDYH